MKKSHFPTKVCPTCNRPFSWRKKWTRCWENVKYCSKRCAGAKKPKEERVQRSFLDTRKSTFPA
ncbi:MAG: DUF2256 domain-containing protein [Bdellovibrionales bacterium]|nr:DUF2256 domain-containing protein [Bdellovibrionales bacterium]